MGVPATLADLNPIAANNSPSGSDPIGTNLDDYLRSHAAMIKQTSTTALGIIPSGTRMPFAQANAPTGWTQAVTDSEDNRMLRVVKTAGTATIGGSHSPILNNVVPGHTHTITINSVGDHAHSVSDPGHSHSILNAGGAHNTGVTGGPLAASSAFGTLQYIGTSAAATGISIYGAGSHTHTGSTNSGSSNTNWTPRYIDMIICSKN